MKTSFNLKIGGQAGEGIKVSGLILARSLTRLGFSVFGYSEYPSLVRGGHNTYQLHAGIDQVYSQIKDVDILIALNQETIDLHQDELNPESLVLYDPGEFKLPKKKLKGKYLAIPLTKLAMSAGGKAIMANMVSIAATLTLLDLPTTTLNEIIKKEFLRKSLAIVELNQKVVQTGKDYVNKHFLNHKLLVKKPSKNKKRLVLTGNEAIGLGAIAGGLKFYAAYPMTPSTSILHFLAAKAKVADILVKHTEDEISAVNMAIGASFAGVRAMTATSGGGLCLMAEGISLSGISETPLVVVNSMRPGPALGMPTWTGQGDLLFVLHLGHDEFPRIVLAPGNSQEAFDLTKMALTYAETYQLPVFILVDKYLSESDYSPLAFMAHHQHQRTGLVKNQVGLDFKRYLLTKNGLSLRTVPGQTGGIYCCNSYEHDEVGLGTETSDIRKAMMDKRMAKLDLIQASISDQPVFGPKKAKLSLISWGSNQAPILQALTKLTQVNFLHLNFLWPFPEKQVSQFINLAEKVVCLEANSTGQLGLLIRKQTGIKLDTILKYDGRPFYPEEIISQVKKFL